MTHDSSRTFIIAEAGVNHDGSLEKALKLVEIAAQAGADAIKFQTFKTDEVVTPFAGKADYQQRQTGEGSQYDMIRKLELDADSHRRIAISCMESGIEFMSTPFSTGGLHLLLSLGVKRIKVASGELTNLPLLRQIAECKLPIILSTGMSTMAEVERAVGWICDAWQSCGHSHQTDDLILLHCTSDYPAAAETVNLRAMDTMAERLGLPVGYSDHTLGDAVSIAAVARGARVLEKHFTIDQSDFGPDHSASLDPEQLINMITRIRAIEASLGDGVKVPQANELRTRELVRRSAYAKCDIDTDEGFSDENVIFLRPAGGIGADGADRLFKAKAANPITAGSMLAESDLA